MDTLVGWLLHEGGDSRLQLLQLFGAASVNHKQSTVVVGKQYSCIFYFNTSVTIGFYRVGTELFLNKYLKHGFKFL